MKAYISTSSDQLYEFKFHEGEESKTIQAIKFALDSPNDYIRFDHKGGSSIFKKEVIECITFKAF